MVQIKSPTAAAPDQYADSKGIDADGCDSS